MDIFFTYPFLVDWFFLILIFFNSNSIFLQELMKNTEISTSRIREKFVYQRSIMMNLYMHINLGISISDNSWISIDSTWMKKKKLYRHRGVKFVVDPLVTNESVNSERSRQFYRFKENTVTQLLRGPLLFGSSVKSVCRER